MPLPVKPAKRRYKSREWGELWEVGTHFTLMMVAGVSRANRKEPNYFSFADQPAKIRSAYAKYTNEVELTRTC
jgi:hypothetical protein